MCKKSPLCFLGQVEFDKFSMIVMIFLTNCQVVLLIEVFDKYPLTNGQMLLIKYNQ